MGTLLLQCKACLKRFAAPYYNRTCTRFYLCEPAQCPECKSGNVIAVKRLPS